MNQGIRERELPEKFATQEYQVLLVAEKYQTGFGQPPLHTMYVDKRLAGIQAVQTLSCLNRTHPLKEDTFVLDFVNDREEIREAFKVYYEGAVMGEEVDPARMYAIKVELDAAGIYLDEEVERFRTIGSKSGFTGFSVIRSWRQESPSCAFYALVALDGVAPPGLGISGIADRHGRGPGGGRCRVPRGASAA